RGDQRGGGDASTVSLFGFAEAEAASESGVAAQDRAGNAQGDGRDGFHRSGNAHANAFDARGRARLFSAEPRASWAILRAAAIAADFQADPDDCWTGPLFPDCKVFPRRRFARGPSAGVYTVGFGDVVSAAGRYFWRDRKRDGAGVRGGGNSGDSAVSAHAVQGCDSKIRQR